MTDFEKCRDYTSFSTEALEEILACMEDSDRYIIEILNDKINLEIRTELVKRGELTYAIKGMTI